MWVMRIKMSTFLSITKIPIVLHWKFLSSLIKTFHLNINKLSTLPKEEIDQLLLVKKFLLKKSSQVTPTEKKDQSLIKMHWIKKLVLDLKTTNKFSIEINKVKRGSLIKIILIKIFQSRNTQTVYTLTFIKT